MPSQTALQVLQAKVSATPDGVFGPLTANAIRTHYGLSRESCSHLLGQCAHESHWFEKSEENLNYTAKRIQQCWPHRFATLADAERCAGNPGALAATVYFGRMGNDTEEKATLYTGRGFVQLTGYDNYRMFSEETARPQILANPEIVAHHLALDSALWYFQKRKIFEIAERRGVNDESIEEISRIVSGGTFGLKERKDATLKIFGWLNRAS